MKTEAYEAYYDGLSDRIVEMWELTGFTNKNMAIILNNLSCGKLYPLGDFRKEIRDSIKENRLKNFLIDCLVYFHFEEEVSERQEAIRKIKNADKDKLINLFTEISNRIRY